MSPYQSQSFVNKWPNGQRRNWSIPHFPQALRLEACLLDLLESPDCQDTRYKVKPETYQLVKNSNNKVYQRSETGVPPPEPSLCFPVWVTKMLGPQGVVQKKHRSLVTQKQTLFQEKIKMKKYVNKSPWDHSQRWTCKTVARTRPYSKKQQELGNNKGIFTVLRWNLGNCPSLQFPLTGFLQLN